MRRFPWLAAAMLLLLAWYGSGQEAPAPAAGLPVGSIVAWHDFGRPTDAPPAGWVPCDGREITDPSFVARYGRGIYAPNLNGAPRPASGHSAGQPVVLRGARSSPVDGYGGSDSAPHSHPIPHVHAMPHTHAHPHHHRVDLRTSTEGGDTSGSRDPGAAGSGTRRHAHDVRGLTDRPDEPNTRGADPEHTQGPSASGGEASHSGTTAIATVPRYFQVCWIIKVAP